jgi:predicted nucleotidyltransferase
LDHKLSSEWYIPIETILQHHNKFSKVIKTLNKEDTSILTRILTGHNNLKHHTHRAKLADNPLCEYCKSKDENDTAMHILTDCVAFSELRQHNFGQTSMVLEDLQKEK